MKPDDSLRDHLVKLLDWKDSHATFEAAVEGAPIEHRGAVPPGASHSLWQLIEHLRLAQHDIHESGKAGVFEAVLNGRKGQVVAQRILKVPERPISRENRSIPIAREGDQDDPKMWLKPRGKLTAVSLSICGRAGSFAALWFRRCRVSGGCGSALP
jgi:hypothetical protein